MSVLITMEVVNMFVLIQMEALIVLVILVTMGAFFVQVNFLFKDLFNFLCRYC